MSLLRGKQFGTLWTNCASVRQLQLRARLSNVPLQCHYLTRRPNLHTARAGIPTLPRRPYSTKAHNGTNVEEDLAQPNLAAQRLRERMRSIRYPVAIITSTDTGIDPNGSLNSWRGLTVSSFTTVSMSPRPMVSFNVHEKSSTLEAIQNSGMFAVHLLSNTPEAVEIASRFAKPMARDQFKEDLRGQSIYAESLTRWEDLRMGADTKPHQLPPKLQWTHSDGPDAVMLQILCEADQNLNVKVGDHVVVFGEVKLVLDNESNKEHGCLSEDSTIRDCLTYSHGRYNVD